MTVRLLVVNGTGEMSGAERVLLRVVAAARAQGWDVEAAAPAGPLGDELAATGTRVHDVPELGLASGPRPLALLRTLVRWARAARVVRRAAAHADLVLVNSLTALPGVRLARPRPPVAWLAHDVVVRGDRLRLVRATRPALAAVIGVSDAVLAPLREGSGTTRYETVHNGVPLQPVGGLPDGPPVVGISALLTPWKGHEVLLDAVPSLPEGVTVELLGGHLPKDEEYAAALRHRAEQPPLAGRVVVLGHDAHPLERMRGWTVLVSASTEPEACPLNVLEAMSLGVPVVATDHGGAPEVLAGAGLLVPPGDPVALAAAITSMLGDPQLRATCARRGRERVAEAHEAEAQTRRLLGLLEELAA